ncbi:helix-turn-helix transcriptional regulator [Cupriavidus oxalaticus]|uniref:Helix-turn-helix domain-containing protein n=1 Tax=Cupriavidus oxalaticus TaxID=96344 RepID=A0A5P3VL46_9BURK|nr:helix-turn-helix transcriptional regulator [Cupriavidus oxalaticus]QEZ46665.1 helix-turn-helix domain-containing protein [Cupriavidus oxalaticus]
MTNGRRGSGPKLFGTGRIVLWRGGSIWIGHAEEQTGFHAHHAIQVTLALSGGPVRVQSPGEDWAAYQAAIIAANHPHAFEARGALIALIFTEPESHEGRMLRERFRAGVASLTPGAFATEAAALAAAYHSDAPDKDLILRARAVTARLTLAQPSPPKVLDKRIEHAIEVLRERIGETVTMTEIAEAVHLSPERFRHLFLKETGIRFRPYVLWLRLELSLASYAAGHNLTEASCAGGFADSAHFSRTFKRMFGVLAVGVRVQRVRGGT